jgi:alkylation response protein AidB-like acyl-CoA dehydrogenase
VREPHRLTATEAQKQKYLTPLASGEALGLLGSHRAGLGSDARRGATTAVRDGDSWTIEGTKSFCTNAHHAQLAVVLCVTDRAAQPHGMSAFVVETNYARVQAGPEGEQTRHARQRDQRDLVHRMPRADSQRLGKEGEGFIDTLRLLDGGRISIAALSVGLAQGAYEAALATRSSGTSSARQSPSSRHPAQAGRHGDHPRRGRLLTYRAAVAYQRGERVTTIASMAKLFASETATKIAGEAVQVMGGYGFIKDYGVEKFYRDVKLCTIGEGTS